MASSARTSEIFLVCCLEANNNIISRILKKNRKSWIGGTNFDINCRDASGRTGLILATLGGSKEIVDMLLSRSDLDVNLMDIFGGTAFMYASKVAEGLEIVKLLLERKDLDLDAKDNDGKTAEDFAAEHGNNEIVKIIRGERSRRMGRVWSKMDSEQTIEDVEDISSENSDIEINETVADATIEERFDELAQSTNEENEDQNLKSQLALNLNERIEKELSLKNERQSKYEFEVDKVHAETKDKIEELTKQIKEVEDMSNESLQKLKNAHQMCQEKSDRLISKLRSAVENIDLNRLLAVASPCSDLECPICLEEMKPPMRIWQCLSGHPVCDTCMRSPRVTACPTCRQKIVGRNVLAEKLAKSMYGNS